MTTLRMRRTPTLTLTVALLLALGLLAVEPATTSDLALPELPPAAEVIGGSIVPALGCIGCIAGGAYLAMGGFGAVLAAAGTRGSALALMGCIAVCHRALVR